MFILSCAGKQATTPEPPPRIDFELEDYDIDDLPEAGDTGEESKK